MATLSAGTLLGPYQILGAIGAGGMGEVYRAKDKRLDRTVAIKVLPRELAADPDRRSRFEREARTISTLNHPHICTLHDIGEADGQAFLVMEHLAGQTLADRLHEGPLRVEQALTVATQIADALAAAHRQGIVHRDLKPANVMLTKSGAKLLDFGLARTAKPILTGDADLSALATHSTPLTGQGTLLGTIPYMAPEQIEGREADARTDIWALGCLLYEMVTSTRAFVANSPASLIGAILKDEPRPMRELKPLTPPSLERLVKTCLAKDPDERWQNAHDIVAELRWIAESGPAAGVTPALPSARRLRAAWTLALVAAAATAGVLLGRYFKPVTPSAGAGVARLTLDLPPGESRVRQRGQVLALSRDGRWLAFAPGSALLVRPIEGLAFRALPGTEDAYNPFFSPDGEWVGFAASGKLKKVSLSGGSPIILCEATGLRGAAWGRNGTIWFTPNFRSAVWRVSADGGEPVAVTALDVRRGEISHRWPELLPGEKTLLFTVKTADITSFDEARIDAVDVVTGRRQTILDGGYHARYTPSGHLVFLREGKLMAAPFDPERLRLTGPAVPVSDGVVADNGGAVQFDFAADGLLAYVPGKAGSMERRLVWVDRRGANEPIRAPLRSYNSVRVSPDGQQLALGIGGANDDIWIFDLARGALTRVTHGGGNHNAPVWAPDGRRLATGAEREGPWNVILLPADGSSGETRLTSDPAPQVPSSFSPDGRSMLFVQMSPKTKGDIWMMSLEDVHAARPLLQTPYDEREATISPDGRWMAYTSDDSGRPEVYVRPFPNPGERWQVSTDGGAEPVWARDGRELFFRLGDALLSAGVQPLGTAFRTAVPRRLFEGQYLRDLDTASTVSTAYDVSPDGRRFAMIMKPEEAPVSQLRIVIHWFDELKRRASAAKQP